MTTLKEQKTKEESESLAFFDKQWDERLEKDANHMSEYHICRESFDLGLKYQQTKDWLTSDLRLKKAHDYMISHGLIGQPQEKIKNDILWAFAYADSMREYQMKGNK